jgi:hypothetical protein
VGESIRIPRKKGLEMIIDVAENCSEIMSEYFIAAIKNI